MEAHRRLMTEPEPLSVQRCEERDLFHPVHGDVPLWTSDFPGHTVACTWWPSHFNILPWILELQVVWWRGRGQAPGPGDSGFESEQVSSWELQGLLPWDENLLSMSRACIEDQVNEMTWKSLAQGLARGKGKTLLPWLVLQLCANSWAVASQLPLSIGFSRQEYWSALPFPSDSGIEPRSPALQGDSLPSKPPGKLT